MPIRMNLALCKVKTGQQRDCSFCRKNGRNRALGKKCVYHCAADKKGNSDKVGIISHISP